MCFDERIVMVISRVEYKTLIPVGRDSNQFTLEPRHRGDYKNAFVDAHNPQENFLEFDPTLACNDHHTLPIWMWSKSCETELAVLQLVFRQNLAGGTIENFDGIMNVDSFPLAIGPTRPVLIEKGQ